MSKQPPYLQIWTATALNMVPPLKELDEAHLAAAVRNIAKQNKRLGERAFLLELANALDKPSSAWRLELKRSGPGKPPDVNARIDRAMLLGPLVQDLVDADWKKEAAVQEAMSELSLSRQQVMRGLRDWARLQKPVE